MNSLRTNNILARRLATANCHLISPIAPYVTSSSAAVDALVARYASDVVTSSPPFSSTSSSSFTLPSLRQFSSSVVTSNDAATQLGSILQREIEEEEGASEQHEGGVPPELVELKSTIAKKWTILEGITGIGGASETGSGATVRMFKKTPGTKGAKIGIVFHCQDTEEDSNFDENDLFNEDKLNGHNDEDEEEPPQAIRFGVVISKGGRTVVIQCRSGYEMSVDSVTVRDGDMEKVLAGLAVGEGLGSALYQGPEFTELAEDLQESFVNYVVTECGVDDDVTAFIHMYCDYCEQEEYVSWMKTAIDILD
jgi:hypothetical protein